MSFLYPTRYWVQLGNAGECTIALGMIGKHHYVISDVSSYMNQIRVSNGVGKLEKVENKSCSCMLVVGKGRPARNELQ